MSYHDLEHPDITKAMRYGYAFDSFDHEDGDYCDHCGTNLDGKNIFSDAHHHALCEECLKNLHVERWI